MRRPDAPISVLELRSVRGTGGGPEKTILTGARASHPDRYRITVCYIRDQRDDVFAIDGLARSLGVDYVEVPERHSFDPSIWPALRRLVRERQIDIVHSHDYKTDAIALMLSRAEPVIPLSTVHGWSSSSLRETLFYYPADRQILRFFPRVIAVSTPIRDGLVRAGVRRERVDVVLNAIDSEAFRRLPTSRQEARARLGLPAGAFVVAGVGRLERVKRFDVLVDAVGRVRRTHPDVHLVIAGDGAEASALARAARDAGLGSACQFLGHRNDVRDVYSAASVLVQSSDTEGTPNAVLEAMAYETPVVATRVGGTVDLIDDGVHGLLVPRRDAAALERAILRTAADPDATRTRVTAARLRVARELSFAHRMARVERIYEDLMTSAAARRRTSASGLPRRAGSTAFAETKLSARESTDIPGLPASGARGRRE